MHRFILWWGIIYFFAFPKIAVASVVLNEIYANPENEDEEFIELYNNSDTEADLKDWKIADLVKSYTVTDLKIPPKSFLVLEKSLTSLALNNSNETVSLTDNNGNSVDSFSYENTLESSSWSRVPDANGSFFNNTSVTKGTNNASPPTPTFTITPTPTKLPSPTKEPTPTKSPSSAKVPTHAETAKKEPIVEDEKTPFPTKRIARNSVIEGPTESVAGINDEREEEFEEKRDLTPNYLYSFTTGIGMLILACVILLYKKFKQKKEEDTDDF